MEPGSTLFYTGYSDQILGFFLNHLNRFSRSYVRADSTVSAGTAVSAI